MSVHLPLPVPPPPELLDSCAVSLLSIPFQQTRHVMALHLPDEMSGSALVIKLLLGKCAGTGPKVQKGSKLLKLDSDGTTLTQVNAICKELARVSCPNFLGASPSEVAQVCCLLCCTPGVLPQGTAVCLRRRPTSVSTNYSSSIREPELNA